MRLKKYFKKTLDKITNIGYNTNISSVVQILVVSFFDF